jgi:hypothetical protein
MLHHDTADSEAFLRVRRSNNPLIFWHEDSSTQEKQRFSPNTMDTRDHTFSRREANRGENKPEASFWRELEMIGTLRMNDLTEKIRLTAPLPGKLLYVTAKKLPFELDGMEPVMLSSLDVCTHLQIVRVYLTTSVASAAEFLDFVAERYPFPIDEVRTHPNWLFSDPAVVQARHRFTLYAARKRMNHTLLLDAADDPIFPIVKNFFFGGMFHRTILPFSQERLLGEVTNFLFFHNNHRSLPTLGGKTPIQVLQSFPEYQHIRLFDPYGSAYLPGTHSAE